MTALLHKTTMGVLVAFMVSGCTVFTESNVDEPAGVVGTGNTVVHSTSDTATDTPPEVPEHIQKKLQLQGISSPSTDVVIRPTQHGMIQEFRANGILYAIKVVPKVGPPYYLISADHQGNFVRAGQPDMLIPSWKIMEWK
ncbi:DUF2782 domain-containing protein [Endozoicomonadaceae bacterium StTr2]